jgi:hypothetical protein
MQRVFRLAGAAYERRDEIRAVGLRPVS